MHSISGDEAVFEHCLTDLAVLGWQCSNDTRGLKPWVLNSGPRWSWYHCKQN